MVKLRIYTYIYYGILMAALLYTFAFEQFISMPIRIAFLAALFLPVMLKDRNMLPAVVTVFFIAANASTGYTMMPTQEYYYAVIAIVALILTKPGESGRQSVPLCIILFAILVTLIDVITGGITRISYSLVSFIPLLMCVDNDSEKLLTYFPWMFIIASACASAGLIYNPSTFLQAYDSTSGFDRLTFSGMNYIAMSLAIGPFLAVVEILKADGKLWKILVGSGSILMSMICLLMLGCRGAIVDIAGASAAYIFLSDAKKKYKVLSIIAIGAICIYLYMSHFFDFVVYRFQNDSGEGGGSNRLFIWADKLEAFVKEPMGWFLGNGFQGMFKMGSKNGVESHNDLIAMLLSYGIVGLTLFIKMLLLPFQNGGNRMLVICCLIFIGLSCMTLQPFTNGIFAFYLFYLYILLLSRQKTAE